MNLPPKIARAIETKLATGKYRSSGEVLKKALDALNSFEREDEEIRASIARSIEEYRSGKGRPGGVVFERVRTRASVRRRRRVA